MIIFEVDKQEQEITKNIIQSLGKENTIIVEKNSLSGIEVIQIILDHIDEIGVILSVIKQYAEFGKVSVKIQDIEVTGYNEKKITRLLEKAKKIKEDE